MSIGWFWAAILRLTDFGDEEVWLELGWKGFLPTFNWKRGILPGEVVLDFLKDWGSMKTWKLLSGIIGFTQGEVSSSFFNTGEGDEPPNWSGSHRDGNNWDLLIFLVVFNIYSGSVTPNWNDEIGMFLVTTPLVATVTNWWKVALKMCWFKFTS